MIKSNDDKYVYASVCVWTLNRYEHLKKCLESLAANRYAEYTDVYISVDYPPSEKYQDGYTKVVKYLESCCLGFNSITVIKQENNIGALKNAEFIENYGMQRNKKLVFIEDDLVFSENYLEFVNKALDYYEDNPNIVGIWGARWSDEYAERIEKLGYNTYLIRWKGCQGEWADTRDFLNKNVNKDFLRSIVYDRKKAKKLSNASKLLFIVCVEGYLERNKVFYYPNSSSIHLIDYLREIWNIMNDNYFVVPTAPKIVNTGYDGSGVHGGFSIVENDVKLDDKHSFDLKPCIEYDPDGSIKIYEKKLEYEYRHGSYIKASILAQICRSCGDNMARWVGKVLDAPGIVVRYTLRIVQK